MAPIIHVGRKHIPVHSYSINLQNGPIAKISFNTFSHRKNNDLFVSIVLFDTIPHISVRDANNSSNAHRPIIPDTHLICSGKCKKQTNAIEVELK